MIVLIAVKSKFNDRSLLFKIQNQLVVKIFVRKKLHHMLTTSRTGTRAASVSATDKSVGLFAAAGVCASGLGATFEVRAPIVQFSVQEKSQKYSRGYRLKAVRDFSQ